MRVFLVIGLFLALTACSTTQVALLEARETPSDRVLAFQKASDTTTSELVIVRDTGLAASGCYYGVMIDQVLAARLDVAERASFKLEPGERVLKIVRDPQGRGLCSVGDDNVEKKLTILPHEVQKYRLSLDMSGQPSLNPFLSPKESEKHE
jgi:hypothetical protein